MSDLSEIRLDYWDDDAPFVRISESCKILHIAGRADHLNWNLGEIPLWTEIISHETIHAILFEQDEYGFGEMISRNFDNVADELTLTQFPAPSKQITLDSQ